ALDTNSNHQIITGAARGPVNPSTGRNEFRRGFAVFGKRRFICIKDQRNYVYCTIHIFEVNSEFAYARNLR
ncbi:hypothetical protein, partial [Escherichia coli]|uniref:hypothetical protein n=1 Tax=Escherichia coli TaxID=562 RepID=UPI0028A0D01E